MLKGDCIKCKNERSISVIDITIQTKGLGNLFKISGKASAKESKKFAKNVMRNHECALETGAKPDSAVLSENPEEVFLLFQM